MVRYETDVRRMEDKRTQQLEALETMYYYNKKLKPAISEVVKELRVDKKEDTDEYLDMVFKGINWVIEVTNGTMELLNEKEIRVHKDVVNEEVHAINSAFTHKNHLELAEILEKSILPFLDSMDGLAIELAGIQEN